VVAALEPAGLSPGVSQRELREPECGFCNSSYVVLGKYGSYLLYIRTEHISVLFKCQDLFNAGSGNSFFRRESVSVKSN
jgi:hypothetical protein